MSTNNDYGYSSKMNPKLKDLLKNYSPVDKSELTAIRNKKPLWTSNTVRKLKLKGYTDDLTDHDMLNVIGIILTVFVLLAILSHY